MAKKALIELHDELYKYNNIMRDGEIVSQTGKKVVVADAVEGIRHIYKGENLMVENDMLVSGTIETVIVKGKLGEVLFEIGKLKVEANFNAGDMGQFLFATYSAALDGHVKVLGSKKADELTGGFGNDVVKGGGGNDLIMGHVGDDKLWGGKGRDVFVFNAGDGKDRIMDFDANGGPGKQDSLTPTTPATRRSANMASTTR